MQEDVADGYRISDLSDYTDAQLFRAVKSNWGYEDSQPFDIIGRLKKEIRSKDGASYFLLEEMHSTNDGSVLLYPLNEVDVRQRVYVGAVNESLFGNKPADGAWVKARVELSRETERVKHNNPFGLHVVDGGLQLLRAIPEEAANSDVLIDGESHVEE